MSSRRRRTRHLFIPLFLIICLLWGCIRNPASDDPSGILDGTISQENGEMRPNSQPDSQAAQKAQADFEALCQTLFEDQVSQSYLTLHYSLADPERYGITDYPKTFGAFSLEMMKESGKEQETGEKL